MFYELLEDGTIGRSTPNEKIAESLGLTLQTNKEIVNGNDGKRYFKGEEPAPTKEEISQLRATAYLEIDKLHAKRDRKTVLGTWSSEEEAEYIEKVKTMSAEIAEKYPYPEEPIKEEPVQLELPLMV